MNARAIFTGAATSLRRAPLRSGLACLGIVIGVAAVVATAGIGGGAKARIETELERPETRNVQLAAYLKPLRGRTSGRKPSAAEGLRREDYIALRDRLAPTSLTTPRVYLSGVPAQAAGLYSETYVEGLDAEGFRIYSRRLLRGELFNQLDVKGAAGVCVVSESLAALLFPDRDPLGQALLIKGAPFILVGVVEDVSSPVAGLYSIQDLHVYVPYTSLLRRVDGTARMTVIVQAPDVQSVSRVQALVGDVMEGRRQGRKALFVTSTALDSIRSYVDGSRTVARLLAAAGTLALIVGGIGIMNIMLVSVTERTREIGVRVALGTRRGDLLRQFVAEASLLSAIGGLLGVAIGVLGTALVAHLFGWSIRLAWYSLLGAFLCSTLVGVFFGYHPAKRAAGLEPVQALRVE